MLAAAGAVIIIAGPVSAQDRMTTILADAVA